MVEDVLNHSGNGLAKRRLAHGALARPVTCVLRYPVNIRGHSVLRSASARVKRDRISERWLVRCVVGGSVGHKTRRLRERLVALVAVERFFTRVRPVVRVQRRLTGKGLVAHAALERFVSGRRGPALVCCRRRGPAGRVCRMVISLVQHQHVRLSERLMANVAHERPFARVCPPVPDHVVALNERFLAEITLVRLLTGVRASFVRLHAAQQRESHVAHVTAVRLLAGVRAPVRGQRAQLQKRLLTYVTLEKLLTGVHLLVFL